MYWEKPTESLTRAATCAVFASMVLALSGASANETTWIVPPIKHLDGDKVESVSGKCRRSGYIQAPAAEEAAVRHGDYNFQGVGLSTSERAFLRARRAQRNQKVAKT